MSKTEGLSGFRKFLHWTVIFFLIFYIFGSSMYLFMMASVKMGVLPSTAIQPGKLTLVSEMPFILLSLFALALSAYGATVLNLIRKKAYAMTAFLVGMVLDVIIWGWLFFFTSAYHQVLHPFERLSTLITLLLLFLIAGWIFSLKRKGILK